MILVRGAFVKSSDWQSQQHSASLKMHPYVHEFDLDLYMACLLRRLPFGTWVCPPPTQMPSSSFNNLSVSVDGEMSEEEIGKLKCTAYARRHLPIVLRMIQLRMAFAHDIEMHDRRIIHIGESITA